VHLLIVDDEPTICWGLSRLGEELGLDVAIGSSAEQGLQLAQKRPPDLLILDVRLPGMDGLTAIERFRQHMGSAPIVIITAYGDLATAVETVRRGAFEYLVKPFDLPLAQTVIQRALRWRREMLDAEQAGVTAPRAAEPQLAGLVGRSAPMQEVFKRVALVAASEACVHLAGESGTGKELIARAIHQFSRRHAGPFVAVNVAALNPALVESEMFGHVRGAFTGAEHSHRGLLEQSHGGTIFLDEVADIPPGLQVKLLRAVEHGEVLPVGAGQPIQVDLRVISATHQHLPDHVADGSFRHDLYFRLSTFQIDLPPLRNRTDDIPALAEHFIHLLSDKNGASSARLSSEALAELTRRPWHGNVRELRNAIEHALILARGGTIAVEHLPAPIAAPPVRAPGGGIVTTGANATPRDSSAGNPADETAIGELIRRWADAKLQENASADNLYEQLLRLVEPPLLAAVLARHQGGRAASAHTLGLHRMTLRKKLAQFEQEKD
jgi:two-component system nitrogen regulation response regulator GlnG